MSSQVPTTGRIVLYTLNQINVDMIKRCRTYSVGHPVELHGNDPAADQVYPMLIVRTWGNTSNAAVNGKVFLDGNDELWVTSVTCGEGQGHFAWPAHV